MAELLARWWNGRRGRLAGGDIWLERVDDGRLRVRWRGQDYWDDEGVAWVPSGSVGLAVVESLIRQDGGPEEEGGPWREIRLSLYRRSDQGSSPDTALHE